MQDTCVRTLCIRSIGLFFDWSIYCVSFKLMYLFANKKGIYSYTTPCKTCVFTFDWVGCLSFSQYPVLVFNPCLSWVTYCTTLCRLSFHSCDTDLSRDTSAQWSHNSKCGGNGDSALFFSRPISFALLLVQANLRRQTSTGSVSSEVWEESKILRQFWE